MRGLFALVSLGLLTGATLAQETAVAIVGATILTGTGEIYSPGTIVYRGGKIESVGGGTAPPEGASTIDGKGLFLTPGLIDAHSQHAVQGSGFDSSKLMAPEADVLGSVQPERDSLWLKSGVTATFVSPGGQNLLGGYGAVVKLTGEVVRDKAALSASFGETALEAFDAPTTRQGMIALLRQSFLRAKEDAMLDESSRAIARVLAREAPLRVLANTPDDILTAIRFAEEFDVRLVLVCTIGGHEVASQIAAASIPVVVGPSIIGIGDGGPYEGFAHSPANAARLAEGGAVIALGTLSRGGRSVRLEGVMAKAHGLSAEAALRALTHDAAVVLGVEDRIGSLAPGKDADLVLWRNHPLGTWGETVRVVVDGATVFVRGQTKP